MATSANDLRQRVPGEQADRFPSPAPVPPTPTALVSRSGVAVRAEKLRSATGARTRARAASRD
jgi:hypothetical protein